MWIQITVIKRRQKDTELRNRRPRLRSGWDDADALESLGVTFLLMDLALVEIQS